ncbi:MAG: thioredoxin family protein [Thermoleophilaceae bacterium]|nr:thioredoxin family protein [Thermoleophilaceae bacterium]
MGALLAGCGGDDGGPEPPPGQSRSDFERTLDSAAQAKRSDFPPVEGRTLQEVANTIDAGPTVGLATADFVPGENRLAFGVIGRDNRFVYGKSAVYVAPTPQDRATGPFPAPARSLLVEPPFRSRGSASEANGLAAVYSTGIPTPRPGGYAVLVITKTPEGFVGAPTTIQVPTRSEVVAVGDPAPRVATETVESANGDIASIDTRVPPSDMHEVSLDDVLGKRPVALLFATPQLCQSRVCGPVTDVALQLKKKYGDQVEFIHQEVYTDNDPNKPLREPLRRFGLTTEPWLFTIDAQGQVAARLEGSFGIDEFEQAIKAAQ